MPVVLSVDEDTEGAGVIGLSPPPGGDDGAAAVDVDDDDAV